MLERQRGKGKTADLWRQLKQGGNYKEDMSQTMPCIGQNFQGLCLPLVEQYFILTSVLWKGFGTPVEEFSKGFYFVSCAVEC